jgi:uncharacterized protein involved in exopolysaccharide biosynthesis
MVPAENVFARDEGIDLIALWKILWRRRRLIIAATVVSTLVAVYLALTTEPIFRSGVVITPVSDSGMGGAASISGQLGGLAALAGVNLSPGGGPHLDAPAILKSRYLVEEFIKRRDLARALLPKRKDPSLWYAVMQFQRKVLDIREDKRTGTTTVSISWGDPIIAAQWANDVVALANELVRARALDDASRNVEYLNKQLDQTNVVELRRVIYNLIENETKTLMLANARKEYAFNVVDPAVAPEERISPRRRVMVMVGMMLGAFLGVVAAFGLSVIARVRALGAV